MATKKRSTGGRATASRKAKPAAKSQRTAKPQAAKARAAKPGRAGKSVKTKPPVAPKRAGADSKEVGALKARFQRERSALEKNLTEAVREIGVLRHHEMRAMQLERQLKERDDLIGRLQQQLDELQRRAMEPVYEREVQQSFTLVAPAREDLDEFTLAGAGEEAQLDETRLEDEEA